jgi:hypothetical protein
MHTQSAGYYLKRQLQYFFDHPYQYSDSKFDSQLRWI